MKVWEKIAEFEDTKGWDKERIRTECYKYKYCPGSIEDDYHFVGDKKFNNFCNLGCGVKCLDEYLELEVNKAKEDKPNVD